MDQKISQLLQDLSEAAANAADSVSAAVQSARDAVSEKYDTVKLNLERSRLEDQQEDIFSDIGRMLFLMHTGKVTDTVVTDEGDKTPQQVIDALLVNAEQVQQQIDAVEEKLGVELEKEEAVPPADGAPCPSCGHLCSPDDVFCAACGGRLKAAAPEEAPAEEAPAPQAGEDQA